MVVKVKEIDDDWRAKKVFIELEKKAKFPKNYLSKINKPRNYNVSRNNSEVVVKFTSSSKNYEALKAHLKYISRNGQVEVLSSDDEIYKGKEQLDNLCQTYNSYIKIPTQKEIVDLGLKEKRETLNIVFSMKDHRLSPANKIRAAAINTLKKKYPNNYFVAAIHNDTDNPHCHVCLKMSDYYGNRINPKKKDVDDIRKIFALELNKLGIEAKATIKTRIRINKNGIAVDEQHNDVKSHHYKVVSFGKAHYKFDENKDMSYYVRYLTNNGKEVDIWSNDLKRVVSENNIHVGEFCRFVVTGEEPVYTTYYDKKTNRIVQKIAYKKTWDVSVAGRSEKKLEPLKQHSKFKYQFLEEGSIDDNKTYKRDEDTLKQSKEISFKRAISRQIQKT